MIVKIILYPLLLILLLVGASLAYLHWGNLENHRELIENFASDYLGRQIKIGGQIDVNLSKSIEIGLGDLSIQNAAWSKSKPQMLSLGGVDAAVNWFDYLISDSGITLESLKLSNLDILIDSSKKGESNWAFKSSSDKKEEESKDRDIPKFNLRDVELENIKVSIPNSDIDISISQGRIDESSGKLKLNLEGKYNSDKIKLEAESEPIREIITKYLSSEKGLPISLDLLASDLSLKGKGKVVIPKPLEGTALELTLKGLNLEPIERIIGIQLPDFVNFDLSSDLSLSKKTVFLKKTDLKLEKSDLRGDASYSWGEEIPSVVADLESTNLEMPEILAPFSSEEKGDSETEAESETDPEADKGGDFNIANFLASIQLDVKTKADRLLVDEKNTLEAVDLGLLLKDKKLNVEPLKLKYFEGQFDSSLQADASISPASYDFKLKGDQFNFTEFLDSIASSGGLKCHADSSVGLKSTGDTLPEIKNNLAGKVGVYAVDGEFDNRLMKILMVGLQDIFSPLFDSKPKIALHCVKVDLDINKGVIDPSQSVIFSEVVKSFFDGEVNIGKSELDLDVSVATSSPSIASIIPPFNISGSFDNMTVLPSLLGTVGDMAKSGFKIADGAIDKVTGGKELSGMAYCEKALSDEGKLMPTIADGMPDLP